jgi:hypothetical protein
MIIKKALYGLKSSGAAFRAHLAETLDAMGYKPSYKDPDVWLRPAVKPDGFKYYEYILCYVDGVLSISADPKKTMRRIQEDFKLKDDKIAEPDVYLGATVAKTSLDNGQTCWTMSPEQYVKAAVTNVEEDLAKHGKRLPSKCVTPFSCNYAPWLEKTPELKADGVQRFQELIGQLRWNSSANFGGLLRSVVSISFWRHRCCQATLRCPESGILNRSFISLDICRRIQRGR